LLEVTVARTSGPRWLDAIMFSVWLMLRPRQPRRRVPDQAAPVLGPPAGISAGSPVE
jgi:hypothetical protein